MWSLKMILAPLWLFETTYASGTWEVTRPIDDNINGNPFDLSGFSVSSNSDATIVAIGEPAYGDTDSGRVRVLAWDTDSWQQISEDDEMIGDDGSFSGWSVALSKYGNALVVTIGADWGGPNHAGRTRVF
eukprot:230583_1